LFSEGSHGSARSRSYRMASQAQGEGETLDRERENGKQGVGGREVGKAARAIPAKLQEKRTSSLYKTKKNKKTNERRVNRLRGGEAKRNGAPRSLCKHRKKRENKTKRVSPVGQLKKKTLAHCSRANAGN